MESGLELLRALQLWEEITMQRSMSGVVRFARDAGLSIPQLRVLFRLSYVKTSTISDVAEYLAITKAGASQIVEQLVQAKLLERKEDRVDRRIRKITLTENGRILASKFEDSRHEWLGKVMETLDPEQQYKIKKSLLELIEAARRVE